MKTVIEMWHKAWPDAGAFVRASAQDLERFASLVRADEREALVESINWTALMRQGGVVTWGDAEELGYRVGAAIRARRTHDGA